MRLVSLHMKGSVEINGIFSLKWRHYGPKRDILDYWGTLISLFVILLYSIKGLKFIGTKQWIREYSAETMVSVENVIPVCTTVLIVRSKIFR